MKLLVLNGPNLNFLGIREPDIYGRQDFAALEDFIRSAAREFQVEVELFQSNYEGALVEKIQWAYGKMDGIVINPAAYTHTSVAILDALKAVSLPAVEVHLSDVNSREPFRRISYPGMACERTFSGKCSLVVASAVESPCAAFAFWYVYIGIRCTVRAVSVIVLKSTSLELVVVCSRNSICCYGKSAGFNYNLFE